MESPARILTRGTRMLTFDIFAIRRMSIENGDGPCPNVGAVLQR